MYCLVDYDPDGIHIMRCYKYGSESLRHELDTNVPALEWLGMRSADLTLTTDESPQPDQDDREDSSRKRVRLMQEARGPSVTAPLSLRDMRKATSLLQSSGDDDEIRRELQVIMFLGVKAEIQPVDGIGEIGDWLDRRLGCV